jgi:hypothetical protein
VRLPSDLGSDARPSRPARDPNALLAGFASFEAEDAPKPSRGLDVDRRTHIVKSGEGA